MNRDDVFMYDDEEDEYASFSGIGGIGGVRQVEDRAPSEGSGSESSDDFDELDDMAQPTEWTKDAGFPDPYGILRVWVDDDDLITKVRITPAWRDKLGKVPLSVAFKAVFMLINNYHFTTNSSFGKDEEEFTFSKEELLLTEDNLSRIAAEGEEISRNLAQLGSSDFGRWEGEEIIGSVPQGLVKIRLDANRKLVDIEFDEEWLEVTTVRNLSLSVVQAHRIAREKWKKPEYVPGKADELIFRQKRQRALLNALVMYGDFE